MRIDRIQLQNFRCYAQAEYEFPRRLDAPPGNGSFHVIIGANGSGKTAILEALAVAASGWFQGVRGDDVRHLRKEDARVVLHRYEQEVREETQYPVRVEASGTAAGVKVRWAREFKGVGRRTNTKETRALEVIAHRRGLEVMDGQDQELPLISYYGTGRLWQEPRIREEKRLVKKQSGKAMAEVKKTDLPEYSEQFASRLAGYRYSVDPRCSPSDLIDWLHFEALSTAQTQLESKQAKIVKQAISKSFEGCSGVEFNLKLGKLLLDRKERGPQPFSLLSDGQRNLVAMIGDIAWKAAQLNPHLGDLVLEQTSGIVLIDELDLHLHPEWQRQAVETLRTLFPQIQFITTTHSPFIVQAAREGEVIVLEGQPVPQTEKLGVEAISRGLMHVTRPDVSPRYREMVAAAKEYLVTLDEASMAPEEKLAAFEERLAAAKGPFADNPAFQAFLELKHEAKLGDHKNGSSGAAVATA
jgi:predicted ATP-binding protein involved in virulence